MTFVTDKPSFAITVAATRTSHEPVMKTGTHTQVPVPMTTVLYICTRDWGEEVPDPVAPFLVMGTGTWVVFVYAQMPVPTAIAEIFQIVT